MHSTHGAHGRDQRATAAGLCTGPCRGLASDRRSRAEDGREAAPLPSRCSFDSIKGKMPARSKNRRSEIMER